MLKKRNKKVYIKSQDSRTHKKIVFFRYFNIDFRSPLFLPYRRIRKKLEFLFKIESLIYKTQIILEDENLALEVRNILEKNIIELSGNKFSFAHFDKNGRYKGLGPGHKEKFKRILSTDLLRIIPESPKTEEFKTLLRFYSEFDNLFFYTFLGHSELEPYASQLSTLNKKEQFRKLKKIFINELFQCCENDGLKEKVKSLNYLDNYAFFINELNSIISDNTELSMNIKEKLNNCLITLNKVFIINSKSPIYQEIIDMVDDLLIEWEKQNNISKLDENLKLKLFDGFNSLIEQAKCA